MKVGIITLNDNNNYGNRLQNYALQQFLTQQNVETETIVTQNIVKVKRNINLCNIFQKGIKLVSRTMYKMIFEARNMKKRKKNFENFTNNYINNTNFIITPNNIKKDLNEEYDYFIVGSDQIWNSKWRLTNLDLLTFAENKKRIAFAASMGIEKVFKEKEEMFKTEIKKFKSISVRENAAKEIIEKLTGRKDVEVLIDPTMLLDVAEWDKIAKKPEFLNKEKYILTYFLGNVSKERKKEIQRFAKENGCKIINLLNKKSKFFTTNPSEFLYLEKNAFLICTDSFHSCIFAMLYNTPFIVYEREGYDNDMISRIDTLLETFNLQERRYTGILDKKILKCDYSKSFVILQKERKKAKDFIIKALDA